LTADYLPKWLEYAGKAMFFDQPSVVFKLDLQWNPNDLTVTCILMPIESIQNNTKFLVNFYSCRRFF
jgi:hypothetical protein